MYFSITIKYMIKLRKPIIILIIFLVFNDIAWCGLRGKINRGNRYFTQQNFDEALQTYRDALIYDPESKELHLNLGSVLYKKEDYEESIKEYEKSTYSKDIILQSKSYYNMGNCLYRSGKLPEAIQFYKKSLELNPKDEDAKYNIEFVQKKIKEQMNKQQGQQQEQQKQGQGKQKKEQKQTQQQQKEQEKKQGMSKEDAERILQAFEENEKNAQKQKKMPGPSGIKVYEDW
ncbi:MAG: hypothetical protein COS17_08665 [Elusimicrobia bacterium CG02_land_8_20_14_3_00_37_13]|nr:MAG: hypothetical protein COS17_08665 [Elusimicrobia bacterium CG02_land_8_20_14_3_00_37_13]